MRHFMIGMNGIQVDLADEHDCQFDLAQDDLEPPVEPVITERDVHPAHQEGVEGYEPNQDDHDQMEAMYVDFAERVW